MQFFSSEELDAWKLRHAVAKPNFDVLILKNNMSAYTDGGVLIGEVFFLSGSKIVVRTKTSDSGYDMGPLIDYTHQYAEFIAERFKQRLLKVMEDGVFGFENRQSHPFFYAEPMTEEILARGLLKGDFALVSVKTPTQQKQVTLHPWVKVVLVTLGGFVVSLAAVLFLAVCRELRKRGFQQAV